MFSLTCMLLLLVASQSVESVRFSKSTLTKLSKGIINAKDNVEIITSTAGIGFGTADTYGESVAVGEALDKVREGKLEEAREDLVEFVTVLCLIDIPGTVQPAGELISGVVMNENNLKMAPVRDAIKAMNKHVSNFLTEIPDKLPNRIKNIGKHLSKFKGKVATAFKNGASSLKTSSPKVWNALSGTAKSLKTYNPLKLIKAAGVIDFLAIGYSSFELGRAAKTGDVDTIVESSIAIAGSLFSIVGALAATGSALGPIGTVVGAILGGIACIINIFKPDPQGDLDQNVAEYERYGMLSIEELRKDFAYMPAVNVYKRKLDWLFENNQGSMYDIKGLRPTSPLTFDYQNIKTKRNFEYTAFGTCPKVKGFPRCIAIGEKRYIDKKDYHGWWSTLRGKQKLIHESDFYGMMSNMTYGGTTIIIRSNHYKDDQKVRGIKIDTLPPLWTTVQTANDHIVLHDLSRLSNGKKVNINLRGGRNTVNINGIVGNFVEGSITNIFDIKLQADKEEPLSVLSFAGMKNNLAFLRQKISGMIYYTNHAQTGRGLICYIGLNHKRYCPGYIDPIPWLATSPFNDKVVLNAHHNMTVVNKDGRNTYVIQIDETMQTLDPQEKISYRIIDSSVHAPNLEVNARVVTRDAIVYREKKAVFEIYGKFWNTSSFGNVDYRMIRRVVFAGSKHMPKTVKLFKSLSLDDISRTGQFQKIYSHPRNGVFYLQMNARLDGNLKVAKSICLCAPQKVESYYYLDMGRGFNVLYLSSEFWMKFRQDKFTLTLVYDKVDMKTNKYGWVLKIRRKDDPDEVQLPRHDLLLKNIHVITMPSLLGTIFDLTDNDAMVTEVDLWRRRQDRITFAFNTNVVGTDLDDYALIFPRNSGFTKNSDFELDLGKGTDTVVITETLQKFTNDLKYLFVNESGNVNMEITHVPVFGQRNFFGKVVIRNVDRVACEVHGVIRTLKTWNDCETFDDFRDLKAECLTLYQAVIKSYGITKYGKDVKCKEECPRHRP